MLSSNSVNTNQASKGTIASTQLAIPSIEKKAELRKERVEKLLDPQSMHAYGMFLRHFGNIGTQTKCKELRDIGNFGAAVAEGAAMGGMLTLNPIGAVVGAFVSTISFLTQKRRAKKNANKPDPFVQYIEQNFDEIRKNFEALARNCQTIYDKASDIHQDLITGVNMIMGELTEISQQNHTTQETLRTSTERILTHVNRNSAQITQGVRNILRDIQKDSWNKAEEWVTQRLEPPQDKIVIIHRKLYDVISLGGKATNSAHTGLSLLESSKNSNIHAIDEWTKGAFHSSSVEALGSLMGYLAYYGNTFLDWQLKDVDNIFNPYIWIEGVNRYIEFKVRFQQYHYLLDPDHERLDNIIDAGKNFLEFIQFLQSNKPLSILNEYLAAVSKLEEIILENYMLIPGASSEAKINRLETFKNLLRNPNDQLRYGCDKVDALLNLFKACCSLAGYQQADLTLINDHLLSSSIFIQNVLNHANSHKASELMIGFPYFHLAMVRKIYVDVNSNTATTEPSSTLNLNSANDRGLYNILLQKTTTDDYFNSHFENVVLQRVACLSLLKNTAIENLDKSSAPNGKIITDLKRNVDFPNKLTEIFHHYSKHYAIWFDDSEKSDFRTIPKELQKEDIYTDLVLARTTAKKLFNEIRDEFQEKNPDLSLLAKKLIELNSNMQTIHTSFKFLLKKNYTFTDNDFWYLEQDRKNLPELKYLILSYNDSNDPGDSKNLPSEDNVSENESQRQNTFIQHIMDRQDLRNAIFDQQDNIFDDLRDHTSFFNNKTTCFMSETQRKLIFLYESFSLPRLFLDLPNVLSEENGNYRLTFANKGIVWLTSITVGNQRVIEGDTRDHLRNFLNPMINDSTFELPIYICIHMADPDHFTTLCVQRSDNQRIRVRYIDSLQHGDSNFRPYVSLKQSIQSALSQFLPNNSVDEITTPYIRQQYMPTTKTHKSECGMHNIFNTLHMLTSTPNVSMDSMHDELKIQAPNQSRNGGLDPEDGLELAKNYRSLIQKLLSRLEAVNAPQNSTLTNVSVKNSPEKEPSAPQKNSISNVIDQTVLNQANNARSDASTAANNAENRCLVIITYLKKCKGATNKEICDSMVPYIAGHRYSELARCRATAVEILHSQLTLRTDISCFDNINEYSLSAVSAHDEAKKAEDTMKKIMDKIVAKQPVVIPQVEKPNLLKYYQDTMRGR